MSFYLKSQMIVWKWIVVDVQQPQMRRARQLPVGNVPYGIAVKKTVAQAVQLGQPGRNGGQTVVFHVQMSQRLQMAERFGQAIQLVVLKG